MTWQVISTLMVNQMTPPPPSGFKVRLNYAGLPGSVEWDLPAATGPQAWAWRYGQEISSTPDISNIVIPPNQPMSWIVRAVGVRSSTPATFNWTWTLPEPGTATMVAAEITNDAGAGRTVKFTITNATAMNDAGVLSSATGFDYYMFWGTKGGGWAQTLSGNNNLVGGSAIISSALYLESNIDFTRNVLLVVIGRDSAQTKYVIRSSWVDQDGDGFPVTYAVPEFGDS